MARKMANSIFQRLRSQHLAASDCTRLVVTGNSKQSQFLTSGCAICLYFGEIRLSWQFLGPARRLANCTLVVLLLEFPAVQSTHVEAPFSSSCPLRLLIKFCIIVLTCPGHYWLMSLVLAGLLVPLYMVGS